MIEKEYYRLDDLKHRFKMTESDVHYLIAEKNVPPCFYMPKTTFIIGGWQKSDFIGYANVNYEGLIAIPQPFVKELANKRKVLPYHYSLLNKAKIQQIDTDYDCELPLPNNYIQGWKAKDLSQINWPTIPAKLYPYVAPTIKHTFKDLLMTFAKDEVGKTAAAKRFDDSFGETPKEELRPIYKTFLFSDICIRHEDLVNCGIITVRENTSPAPLLSDANLRKLENEFEDLLAAIILSSPKKLTAKKIHRILCEECEREEDKRHFDTNNILLGEDQGVISWRDKYRNNKERSYLQSSLDNVISTVKSKIGKA
ncbi:hypothetical protein [Rheinheimera sp.]|uniref:hypothetical protein n=1 Tax=Rheinheimera sp. TaxID=1869214 RepID=UPI002354BCE6|nr:hypothetical protein [Rheinheimera sp.]